MADSTPPQVTLVNSWYDTGDGELSEGEVTDAAIYQLLISFSEPVRDVGAADADSVTEIVNSTLVDNLGLSKVEVRVDTDAYQLATGTATWSLALDASQLSPGSHTLRARATDMSGNVRAHSITIVVAPPGDTQPPIVNISSPAAMPRSCGRIWRFLKTTCLGIHILTIRHRWK